MKKCWYTIILTVSLAVMAVGNVLPGWVHHAAALEKGVRSSWVQSSEDWEGKSSTGAQGQDETLKPVEPIGAQQEEVKEETDSEGAPADNGGAAVEEHTGIKAEVDLSDTLFIGDSRTVGLSEYGNLGSAEVFANSGMSVYNLSDTRVSCKDGVKRTLEQVLSNKQYQRIYLMLGINELGYNYQKTVTKYESVVAEIQELQPEAMLVLQANLHVTREKSEKSPAFNNINIDALNEDIRKIADRRGCSYLDVNELFDDGSGNLDAAYSADGSHILGKYYLVWADWIKKA